MARAIAGLVVMAILAVGPPASARGHHRHCAHHGHPINAWQGSHRLRLRLR